MRDPSQPSWTSAHKIAERVEPCDIIEIRFERAKPPKSHFIFNIRKGWCVNVIPTVEVANKSNQLQLQTPPSLHSSSSPSKDEPGSGSDSDLESISLYEGFKDAIDLISLAGRNPCRINNLDELASTYGLRPRSRKDAMQIARAGLAEGAIPAGIRSGLPGDPQIGEDISRQFCLYWKYLGAAQDKDAGNKFLDKTVAVCGLVLVLLAAVVATTLSM